MTLALQEKRVNGDASKSHQQGRPQVIAQVRGLHALHYRPPQRFLSRTLDRPAELAQITFYAGKR
jgi:hypothetical protein